jgi:DNA-binding NarL/FixJ family response regulator
MSPLLIDIIEQSVTGHVALDIVAHLEARNLIEERLRVMKPDLVLVGLYPGEADEIGRSLLSLVPVARVIVFSSDARHAYLHEMQAHRVTLIDVSPPALIEAIRGLRPGSEVSHRAQRIRSQGG